MAVITISRQMGSSGDYIANLLASMLSYDLVNKQSIIMEAQSRGMITSETVDKIHEGKPPLIERFTKSKSQAVYAMRSIMREMVTESNAVVVGRGGHIELKDRTDLFKVRIIAPLETRIRRIRQENEIGRDKAMKMLKQSDKERAEYVKHFFLVDCSDPEFYDIVINTGKISPDAAARLIMQALRQVGGAESRSAG